MVRSSWFVVRGSGGLRRRAFAELPFTSVVRSLVPHLPGHVFDGDVLGEPVAVFVVGQIYRAGGIII